ncbi:aminopeptidase P family protein [Synergistaceae bacterium OttesenSCG-928-I11]|nr:aminopeptidase P family protein [Synergistaceae bacterium OttesenSCG-928-I11]
MNIQYKARRDTAFRMLDGLSKTGGVAPDVLLLACQDGVGWQDIYYYTGFVGSSGVFLLSRDEAILFIDPRYEEATGNLDACRVVSCAEVRRRSPLQAALDYVSRKKITRLAYGGVAFSHAAFRAVETALGRSVETLDVSSLLFGIRRRKSTDEVSCIRRAVGMAAKAYTEVLREAHVRMTEQAFAALLSCRMHLHGADFRDPVPIMVASGARVSQPHALPTDKKFSRGDLVVVDFGARAGGYVCDITRMFSVGEPSPEARNLYSILTWAQTEAASKLRPGIAAMEVDAAARGVLASAGLGEAFVHGTGHGIGLCVHEPPSLSASSGAVLAEGDVVTIEPGIYRPGALGMRVEDDYLVTANGAVCLTQDLNKDLHIV